MGENKQEVVVVNNKSINFTAYDVKWVPGSRRVVSAGGLPRGTGTLKVWDVHDNEMELVAEVSTYVCFEIHCIAFINSKETEKSSSFKCSSFAASTLQERHLATGDFLGKLSLWYLILFIKRKLEKQCKKIFLYQ